VQTNFALLQLDFLFGSVVVENKVLKKNGNGLMKK